MVRLNDLRQRTAERSDYLHEVDVFGDGQFLITYNIGGISKRMIRETRKLDSPDLEDKLDAVSGVLAPLLIRWNLETDDDPPAPMPPTRANLEGLGIDMLELILSTLMADMGARKKVSERLSSVPSSETTASPLPGGRKSSKKRAPSTAIALRG